MPFHTASSFDGEEGKAEDGEKKGRKVGKITAPSLFSAGNNPSNCPATFHDF